MKLEPTIITQKEHAGRRMKLMKQFGPYDLLFFPGNREILRNPDVPYEFRQESNMRYLTGINLPDVSAMLVPRDNKYILFASNQTLDDKVWDGNMPTHKDLKRIYRADEVYEPSQMREVASKLGASTIHTLHSESPFNVPMAKKEVDGELATAMIEMRLIKSDAEIQAIEKAINITGKGYDAALRVIRPGMREHEVQAALEYQFRVNGAEFSFPSIVTMDGNVLHNFELRRQFNNSILQDGRMLLIDSGADVEGYSGDITRTFPINGKFSKMQADIYEIVLKAKREVQKAMCAGVRFKIMHELSEKTIAEGLQALGILKSSNSYQLIKGARLFIAHGLGHAMGLDDHDIGEYKDRVAGYTMVFPRETDFAIKYLRFARTLMPGHVVTTEPGIYFIDAVLNNPQIRKDYKGIVDFNKALKYMVTVSGIRLEDDVLIQKDGSPRVLGPPIPQVINQIELIMRK